MLSCFLLILLCTTPCNGLAVEAPATTLLTLIDSARSRGIGGAGAALADDPGLVWISPSAAGTSHPALTLGGQRGYIGDTAWQVLGATPFGDRLSAFAAFAYYDAGPTTDGAGRTISAQQDLLGDIGGTVRLTEWLTGGVGLKAMRSVLAGSFVARVLGADGGVRAAFGPVAIAAGVNDAGARARYQGTASPNASVARAGGAYEVPGDVEGSLPRRMRFLADAVVPFSGAEMEWHGGAEAVWQQGATLRAGVTRSGLPARWAGTLGFGIGSGWYRLEYATVLGTVGGAPQILSVTVLLRRAAAQAADSPPAAAVPVDPDCVDEGAAIGLPPP